MAIQITPARPDRLSCSSCSSRKTDRNTRLYDLEISPNEGFLTVITICDKCLTEVYSQCAEIFHDDDNNDE